MTKVWHAYQGDSTLVNEREDLVQKFVRCAEMFENIGADHCLEFSVDFRRQGSFQVVLNKFDFFKTSLRRVDIYCINIVTNL